MRPFRPPASARTREGIPARFERKVLPMLRTRRVIRNVVCLGFLAGAPLWAKDGMWDNARNWDLNQSSPKIFYQVKTLSSTARGEMLELLYDFKDSGWSEAN